MIIKESTLKGRDLHLHPKRGLPIGNIGFLISNAKAQMSKECQSPKSKNVIGLTFKTGIPCALYETEWQKGFERGVTKLN
jgi:hypothetical protein